MDVLLDEDTYRTLRNMFIDIDDEDMIRYEKYIINKLFRKSSKSIDRIIHRGFDEEYKDLNAKEWILFTTELIGEIENDNEFSSKEDERNTILIFICFIIIYLLPIGIIEKQSLMVLIREFLPDIIENIIIMAKKIRKSKFIKKLLSCMCGSNKNKNKID